MYMEISVVSSFAEKEVIKPAVKQLFAKMFEKSYKKVCIIFAVSEKACNFAPAFERDGKQIDRVLRLTR